MSILEKIYCDLVGKPAVSFENFTDSGFLELLDLDFVKEALEKAYKAGYEAATVLSLDN